MIRKLRWQFVGVCMALVLTVLAAVFAAAYHAVRQNIEDLSRQVLTQVIREDGSGSAPGVSVEIGGDRLLLPYFTVNIWGGTAYITGGTYANLEDTDALRDILSQCLEQNQTEGTVEDYHLRYLVEDNGLYRKLAFVDMSMEQATLARVIRSYLVIALAALLVLLGIAAAASRWVTRPVERAWRQQRQFLSDASHELKTPLTVILSNAELLEGAALPEKPARWSGNIRCEAEQMRTLVEQMLTLARADNGVRPAAMEPVNFSDVATECVLSFEPVAFEAGKPLEDHVAEDVTVTGDRDRLRHLISILLDNAVKYGAPGGTITLTLERTERQARLTVANPGDPIPPEHLPHLFERFYRADSSRGEQSGFGLGLSIADTIAREHKGSLRAESDAVSTRFIFTLPSVNKGKHGFSELKQCPASFSSLPGGSPAASSASLSRRFQFRKTPKDFPASKNGR
ncbi:sensor histidine kinase [Neopoerus faecalis]|uniref:sensor histidine kinase n=1 Tax=Neopoerus faecalis TaxID=3032125 RepID=UPI00256FF241|nr:HAMP domain-containing sensor histidine kinase [Neopoerus faecalis]